MPSKADLRRVLRETHVAPGHADGDEVVHPAFGAGTVSDVADGEVTVLFDDAGYRRLDVDVVEEHGLLSARDDRPA